MSVIIEQAGNNRTRCPIISETLVQLQPILLSLYKLMSYCNSSKKILFTFSLRRRCQKKETSGCVIYSYLSVIYK